MATKKRRTAQGYKKTAKYSGAYILNPGWRWAAWGTAVITYPSGVNATVGLLSTGRALLTVTKNRVREQHEYAGPISAMNAADEEHSSNRYGGKKRHGGVGKLAAEVAGMLK
jgi:hypothetical protein